MNEKEKLQKQLKKFERWLNFGAVEVTEKPKFKNKFKRKSHGKKPSTPIINSETEGDENG